MADRRVKLWQIAEEVETSKEKKGQFLKARWPPRILTRLDKIWKLCQSDLDEIWNTIVIADETYVRQYGSESKRNSMQWIKRGKGEVHSGKVGVGYPVFGQEANPIISLLVKLTTGIISPTVNEYLSHIRVIITFERNAIHIVCAVP